MKDLLMGRLFSFELGFHEDLLDQIVRLTVDHQERKRLFCFCLQNLDVADWILDDVGHFLLE
jgi:hypothetical protein